MIGRSRSFVRKAVQPPANAAITWKESGVLTPVAAVSCAQMITRNICNVDAATLCEKSFISPGQQIVCRTVGNNQDFEQGKRRCDQLLAARTHFSKKGLNQRKKPGMFFNEVDEDGRVCPYRAAPEIGHQSHEARSRSTCFEGSTPLQCSLPNPLRPRIDRGFGVSRASLRRCVTS
jgi:hypothetical protein